MPVPRGADADRRWDGAAAGPSDAAAARSAAIAVPVDPPNCRVEGGGRAAAAAGRGGAAAPDKRRLEAVNDDTAGGSGGVGAAAVRPDGCPAVMLCVDEGRVSGGRRDADALRPALWF